MTPAPKEQPSSVPYPLPAHQPGSAPVSIIIADDHILFNDGIMQLLSTEKHLNVVQQVFHGNDVLPHVVKCQPQLLLLDINLPGANGIEIAGQLKKNYPALKIIFISMYSDV